VIAADYGLTRKRIWQIAHQAGVSYGVQGRAAVRREAVALRAEVRMVQTALRNGPCRVCDGPNPRRGTVTCAPRCTELYQLLRWHLDNPRARKRRATSILNHAADRAATERAWAHRIVAGHDPGPNRRWVVSGTAVARAFAEMERLRAETRRNPDRWWD
jgi:hypothetical protein